MTRVSIIVCTRDRAAQLQQTLDALSAIDVPTDCSAELLIVDSASTDQTPAVVASCWFAGAPAKYIREEFPGLSRARNRGVDEATGDILLFTDDDVRPPAQWISAMCAPILEGRASAVAGGVSIAPSLLRPWMDKLHRVLMASTEHLDPDAPCNLVGANMAVAKKVFARVKGFDPEIGAGALGYGEEVLFSGQLRQAGFTIAYTTDATVEHHFDPSRLSRSNLLEAAKKLGRSNAYVTHHWSQTPVPRPRIQLARARARLLYYRARRGRETRAAEGAPMWEIQLLSDIHFFKQYLRERTRTRRYEAHGLSLLMPDTVPSSPVLSA